MPGVMDKVTKDLLNLKRVDLVEEIDLNVQLWNELRQRGVVTKTQKENIIRNDRHTLSEQVTELLDLLPRRGQHNFTHFCLALVATEQDQVVTDVLQLDVNTLKKQAERDSCQAGGDTPRHHAESENIPANAQTTSTAMETTSLSGSSDAPPTSCLPGGSSCQKRPQEASSEGDSPGKRPRSAPHEMEEDGFELTDAWGYDPEPVITSTEHFYLAKRDPTQVYPMHSAVRGYCLIINVMGSGQWSRRGTEVDCSHLVYLFRNLHYEVVVYSDQDGLSAKEIYQKVATFFQMAQHAECNSAAMWILSHGDKDNIYGTDGHPVQLIHLYKMMNDCPGLENKPKLVFLEACAGLTYDDGKMAYSLLAGEDEEDAPKLPFMTDFFIGRPSQPGMRAHRNTKQGSWYVQAIVKVFTQLAATRSLPELMIKVNAVVAKKESKCSDPARTGKKQMPDERINLRRNLYFFPGIQRTHP